MTPDFCKYALAVPEILLPDARLDLSKWAVVACDQYTAQPEYWAQVQSLVGDAPSSLNIVYPEAWLSQGDARIQSINRAMGEYAKSALTRRVDGFVLVERTTESGARLGLMAAIDLEAYDYSPGANSPVRATEGTILSRIPPRVRIRERAPLELPHILILLDDPGHSLIEPLHAGRDALEPLYDFELMQRGGHLRGWKVARREHEGMASALQALWEKSAGLMYAVGDGNHSLATAKACWMALRDSLTEAERALHPARYALVEITNLHDPALKFQPIHRALFHVDSRGMMRDFGAWLAARGMGISETSAEDAMFDLVDAGGRHPLRIEALTHPLPLAILQSFLDEWLPAQPDAEIDYVHGDDVILSLAGRGACGFLLRPLDKFSLFQAVRVGGALPRKTFSMGHANEKRFYLECRRIRQAEDING